MKLQKILVTSVLATTCLVSGVAKAIGLPSLPSPPIGTPGVPTPPAAVVPEIFNGFPLQTGFNLNTTLELIRNDSFASAQGITTYFPLINTSLIDIASNTDQIPSLVSTISNLNLDDVSDIVTETDKIPDILTKVRDIDTQLDDVFAATDGLQELVGNVNSIYEKLPQNVLDDLEGHLDNAQELFNFAKAQAVTAFNNRTNHPNVVNLLSGMENLIKALMGDAGSSVNLNVLSQLLGILPQPVLDILGQGLLVVGIDQNTVTIIEQGESDVLLLSRALVPVSSCEFSDNNRADIKLAANKVNALGIITKLAGKGFLAIGNSVAVGPIEEGVEIGIHGYAHLKIKNSTSKIFGNILGGLGDAMIPLASAANDKVNHCETLANFEESRYTDDEELAIHQTTLLNAISASTTSIEVALSAQAAQNVALSNQISVSANNILGTLSTHHASVTNEMTANNTAVLTNISANTTTITTSLTTAKNELSSLIDTHDKAIRQQHTDIADFSEHLLLRIQIERSLAEDKAISFFYLPESNGGKIELVRDLVIEAMNENSDYKVSKALKAFQDAENKLAATDYKGAWDKYSKAYREVVKHGYEDEDEDDD